MYMFAQKWPSQSRCEKAIKLLRDRGLEIDRLECKVIKRTNSCWYGKISRTMVLDNEVYGFVIPAFSEEPTTGVNPAILIDVPERGRIARVTKQCSCYELLGLELTQPCSYMWLEQNEEGKLMFIRIAINPHLWKIGEQIEGIRRPAEPIQWRSPWGR